MAITWRPLGRYARELRATLGTHSHPPGSGIHSEASELQMQHQELAAMMTRERLAVGLANRPAAEQLQQRNILPVPEAEQQLAAKRKRLEGFLAGRPPAPEFLQQQPQLSPQTQQPQLSPGPQLSPQQPQPQLSPRPL